MNTTVICIVATAVIIFLMALKESKNVEWAFWTTVEELKENMLPGLIFVVIFFGIIYFMFGSH